MIRYDQKLTSELTKAVKNYNAKINRLARKGMDLSILPEKVSVKDLKSTYQNRSNLQYRIRQLRKFSERGAEQVVTTKGGARVTKYHLDILRQDVRRTKAMFTRRIKKISNVTPTVFGRLQGYSYGQMGSEELDNLISKRRMLNKDISSLKPSKLGEFRQFVNLQQYYHEKKAFIFFTNIADIIAKAGWKAGVDQAKIDYVINALSKLNYKQFDELQRAEQSFKSIVNYYDLFLMEFGDENDPAVLKAKDEFIKIFDALYENIDTLVQEYKEK